MTLALIWLTGAAFTLLLDVLIHAAARLAGLIDEPYQWRGGLIIIGLFWPGVLLFDLIGVGRRGR